MNKTQQIKIQTLNNQLKQVESLWYTKLPQDSKNQNRNNYLDSCIVYWVTDVTWRVAWAYTSHPKIILSDTNYSDEVRLWYNQNELTKKIKWNLQRNVINWWIEIPISWTYNITVQWVFRTDLVSWSPTPPFLYKSTTISWTTFNSVDDTSKKLVFLANLPNKNSSLTWYVYTNSKLSNISPDWEFYTVVWPLEKWNMLYIYTDHRRNSIVVPVVWIIYITKIS